MQELASSVTDPSAPRYQRYFTPEEIRAIAAPPQEEYDSILADLRRHGVTVVRESSAHLSITVRGERAYLARLKAEVEFAKPRASNGIESSIESIVGLTNGPKRHHSSLLIRSMTDGDANGLQPPAIKQAYDFNPIYQAGFTGKGQHIAIATYDAFYLQDIRDYYVMNHLDPMPSVDQVKFNGTPDDDVLSAVETESDAEFAGMIAPGASIHVFASAKNGDAGEQAIFTTILDDNRSKIVTYSWGTLENTLDREHKKAMDALFSRAVAQGVTIFVATGDGGAQVPDFPAGNPNVVAVGGTTLTDTSGARSELAWSGSGGGISTFYPRPSYQAGLDPKMGTGRDYPDVAFNADPSSGQPTWVHYDPTSPMSAPDAPSYYIIGGTSIASPQWAGFMALVDEARGSKKHLGLLNPWIYAIPTASVGDYFNDIVSGSNGMYSAGPGFDLVTGLGSMMASALFSYLQAL
ncbi:MAG: S53 family peptidase [Oligoflexia bacterium]|nr:S53 family peptidase [Oligoflexia bacterium]